MLKKFTISNYRSFYDEAVLDLTIDIDKENECRFIKKINNEYISIIMRKLSIVKKEFVIDDNIYLCYE